MFSQYHYGMLSSGHGWYGDHPVICVFVLGAPHGVVVTQAPGLMTNTPDFWAILKLLLTQVQRLIARSQINNKQSL